MLDFDVCSFVVSICNHHLLVSLEKEIFNLNETYLVKQRIHTHTYIYTNTLTLINYNLQLAELQTKLSETAVIPDTIGY